MDVATLSVLKASFMILNFDPSIDSKVAYPFAHGKPYVSVSITGQDHLHSASVGNSLNPAYVSHSLENFELPMSFSTRVSNFILFHATPLFRYLIFFLPVQIQVRIFECNLI